MRKGQQRAGIGAVNMSSQEEESYPRIQKKERLQAAEESETSAHV